MAGINATSSTNEFLRAYAAGLYSPAASNGVSRAGVSQPRVSETYGGTVDKTKFGAVVEKYAAGGVETSKAVTAPREIETGTKVNGKFFMSNLNALQANYQNANAFRGVAAVDGYASQKAQVSDDLAQYDALKNFKSGNLVFVR